MIKFSIIIPTIFRDELQRTLDSIEGQLYTNYEVIIMYDGVETPELRTVADGYETDKVKVYFTGEKSNDFGHTPRVKGWDHVTGDYILYMDDDDWFINDTMQVIAEELGEQRPDWGIFPAWKNGSIFETDTPKYGTISSIQHFHKKYDSDGNPIKWISGGHGADGEWATIMSEKYEPFIIEGTPLVRIDNASSGSFIPVPFSAI